MSHVDRVLVETFLTAIDSELVPRIEAAGGRLKGNAKLLNRYRSESDAWRNGRVTHVRGITEAVNELCVARLILEDKTVGAAEYESPIEGTQKTIDFLVMPANLPGRIYYDVKTIQPEERDGWERYQRAESEGWFSPGTELVLDREWMGGEIAHDLFAARQKFLEYARELEEKIRHFENRQENRFALVFCSDGYQWRCDHLEDFADFYSTGRHRADDGFGTMERHYLETNVITLERTINGFCYLERAKRRVRETLYRPNVRGPRLPFTGA